MSDFLNNTPAARNWMDEAIQRHSKGTFGKLAPAVIWTDERDNNGRLLVPIDPVKLVAGINSDFYPLLHNHDPGKPKGQILESANFKSREGIKFIVAVVGYYSGGEVLNFRELGFDKEALVPLPENLPVLPDDAWIGFATDPSEVDAEWLNLVTSEAPLQIERVELSHNTADSIQELIRISLPYLAIVWNPFIKSIASEAGKDTYAAIHKWVRKLLNRLIDRFKPILDIQTHQDGCQVSFLLRGRNVKQHYIAHDALSNAAAQAAQLITKLIAKKMPAQQLVYEFDVEALMWFPSYAILNDNRIILDSIELIAIEQLPTGLSLGLILK
jgi:hypothetical protein